MFWFRIQKLLVTQKCIFLTGSCRLRELPDPNDRHVLTAAIKSGAQVIVTCNVNHFPAETLSE